MNPYNIIAKPFYDLLDDVLDERHTHYWLKGGRGSTKSSFIGIAIPLKIMLDFQNGIFSNAVVLRKVGDTLADSVYAQIIWGIEQLKVSEYWDVKVSPLQLKYKPSGQVIKFRSSNNKDDYRKLKSTKFQKGFCKYVWFEELDEFFGMEEVRNILQSLLRGGSGYQVFYSYNPPKLLSSWVNTEVLNEREDRIVHSSTYLDVPVEWLGEQFIIEAEHLKKTNELAYRNEYLGEPTGTGGAVFTNVHIREITDKEIKQFDNILDGNDFGYAVDPDCYLQMQYDKTRKRLFIFNEIYKVGMSNKKLADEIKRIKIGHSYITCDSAEPKSIDELRAYGLLVKGAKKGADSIDYGIRFLQNLEEIVIDNKRCPNTAREFSTYEYDKDKYGNFVSKYPDKNNHSIDAARYAIEDYTIQRKWEFSNRRVL
ncbi:MAG TPA: PBSX family phage terminase large subunit [Candidatus Coprosoma intestinipullorum]|uniref:PBSX family phage terminase large subunit n=1 Tax=Candidatus Coprosoma intestinipullorum TaxID=2840752 RepID=A0A9D0ZRW9_9FIRM|nr:PBSX family phage terminase large subunit [Candidatus Coprosoma intestinipullorum]